MPAKTLKKKPDMDLILHPSDKKILEKCYRRAFSKSVELFIVTAYLTEWSMPLTPNSGCRHFRFIIGKDFGITRKAACRNVMRRLPSARKHQFMVANSISGFHPKALFWREPDNKFFCIVGSSNLTHAAFKTNFEANLFTRISPTSYAQAKRWIQEIEQHTITVSEGWLNQYREASLNARGNAKNSGNSGTALLPKPRGVKPHIQTRRSELVRNRRKNKGLIRLFQRCETGKVSSQEFYQQLPNHWVRLQGRGWEIRGKNSDFRALSKSYLRIINAMAEQRDDVVAEEIDSLHDMGVTTRKALLSEFLCLKFPREYPIWNHPVLAYLKDRNWKAPRGASEGARYIALAKTLRHLLDQNPNHPAKNLAELDTVLWLHYGI